MKELKPVLDKKNLFMFFGNHKVALTSVVRHALRDRAIVKKSSEKYYNKKFNGYSEKQINKMFKFTIVRNPFDRIVSGFFYLRKHGILREKNFNKKSKTENNIAGFRDFIKNEFRIRGPEINEHLRPMYLCAEYVDFVGRLERINEDWKVIANKIQCPVKKLQKKNITHHLKYSVYYDKKTIQIVSDIYSEDLKVFGYKFKGKKK